MAEEVEFYYGPPRPRDDDEGFQPIKPVDPLGLKRGVYTVVGGELGRLQSELVRSDDRVFAELVKVLVEACRGAGLGWSECREAGEALRQLIAKAGNTMGGMQGWKRVLVAAAVIRAASLYGRPLSLVARALGISQKELKAAINLVVRVFGGYAARRARNVVEAVNYVAKGLGLCEAEAALAERIALAMVRAGVMGRSLSVAAAAVYVAARLLGRDITMERVASAAGITSATIREVLKRARLTVRYRVPCLGEDYEWRAGGSYLGLFGPSMLCGSYGAECYTLPSMVRVSVGGDGIDVTAEVRCGKPEGTASRC